MKSSWDRTPSWWMDFWGYLGRANINHWDEAVAPWKDLNSTEAIQRLNEEMTILMSEVLNGNDELHRGF